MKSNLITACYLINLFNCAAIILFRSEIKLLPGGEIKIDLNEVKRE